MDDDFDSIKKHIDTCKKRRAQTLDRSIEHNAGEERHPEKRGVYGEEEQESSKRKKAEEVKVQSSAKSGDEKMDVDILAHG